MIIQIPFSGFYESIHSSAIDDAINYTFTDYASGIENNDRLSERLYDSLNWRDMLTEYAKEYADTFAYRFGIELEFESLSSPREYNFTTDRIFCRINEAEVLRLYASTDKNKLDQVAREMFTSRDGFNSFYDPDPLSWGEVSTWDYNQLYALLVAYVDDDDFETYLMDNVFSDGTINDLLYKHCSDKRIFKIHDYLQSRKAVA